MKKLITNFFAYAPIAIILILIFWTIFTIVSIPYRATTSTFLDHDFFDWDIPIPWTENYVPSIGKQLVDGAMGSIPENQSDNIIYNKRFQFIALAIVTIGLLRFFWQYVFNLIQWILSLIWIGIIGLKNKLLSPIYKLFGNSKKTVEKPTPYMILTWTYLSFLRRYIEIDSTSDIWKTHKFLFKYLAHKNSIPLEWKELSVFRTPFELQDTLGKLNNLIGNQIYKDAYLDDFFMNEDVIDFRIKNTWSFTGDGIKKKLIEIENEIYRRLPGFELEESPYGNMKIITLTNDIKVEFTSIHIWESQSLNLADIVLPKWKALVGFYPEVINRKIQRNKYLIDISKLYHSFVVGTTRSGKDVFILNFIFSILKQISVGWKYDLHFLDTKISDGAYLDNMKSHGVFRYASTEEYISILSKLNQEMEERQKIFQTDSNIITYNKNNPQKAMNEVIIVINEVLSLFSSVNSKDAKVIADLLINLLSKGAWAGFKVFLMSQSMRKDIDPNFWGILTNITTRFATRISNKDDRDIVARGMPFMDAEKLSSLIKYNCAHIDNSQFVQEFRAYNISQEQVQKWIQKTFSIENTFKNPKLNEYFTHVKKSEKISMEYAMNTFWLTRWEWDEFIQEMETRKLIQRSPWKPLAYIGSK